jgi:hypothetical protein
MFHIKPELSGFLLNPPKNNISDIIYNLANQLGKYVDSLGIEEIIIGYN